MNTDNLSMIDNNKYKFKTDEMKIPVILHVSEQLLPNDHTFNQLENLAKDDRLYEHIAAMSDVHPKKGRKNPTGTVIASDKYLMPQINDTAPNCGMRLIKTDLNEDNITEEEIDKMFKEFVKVVPTKKYIGNRIPYKVVMDVAKHGIKPLREFLNARTKNEVENSFKGGDFSEGQEVSDQDLYDVIPKLFFFIAKYRMGILGAAGNHFLDLMKITELKNEELAKKMGIKKGQYIFLLHTGSGLTGQYASYMYTPKRKEHLSQQIILKLGTTFFFDSKLKKVYKKIAAKIKEYQDKDEFLGYDETTEEGKMFMRAHKASANFGFANRVILTDNIDRAMERALGRQVEMDLLYDMPHILIEKENHFGQDVWIHRNGTTRANGPSRMSGHSLFSQTGEPVFMPSSMSTPAYLGVGTDNNSSSFFSASHGTGKSKEEKDTAAHSKEELLKKMEKRHVKLYNAKSKDVIKQDSGYYKDIEEVVKGMEENQIVNAVAKMEPVAVLMY